MTNFFFDSYAIFELINGNPAYFKFRKGTITTTKLNLLEVHYGLIDKYGIDFADYCFDFLSDISLDLSDDVLKTASQLRNKNKKHRMSYIDCIGYTVSIRNGCRFLTGDEAFRNFPNVEFVK